MAGPSRQQISILSYSLKYRPSLPGHFPPLTHLFDCRAIDNPGRIDTLKTFTGLDLPVIRFFEANERAMSFGEAIDTLILDSIDRYLDREYGPLSIAFGCTGGQHRSVYFASRLHARLKSRYGDNKKVHLTLEHLDIQSRYGQT